MFLNHIPRALLLSLLLFTVACASAAEKKAEAEKIALEKRKFRALYVPIRRGGGARSLDFMQRLVAQAKPLGVNAFALDAQVYNGRVNQVNQEVVDFLKAEGMYTIVRVVCFQGGITRLPIEPKRMEQLHVLVEEVSRMGFDEVQLDYIRFEDSGMGYGLTRKHEFIAGLVTEMREITDRNRVKLSADIFGRIVYNRADGIGQNLELFAQNTDVIYPMLYPSHFTGDRKRMSDPAFTMTEGTTKAIDRLAAAGLKTQIMPFIQVFVYNIQHARVPLWRYVQLQIEAVEATPARGWMAWNAAGDYSQLFRALSEMQTTAAAQP